METIDEFEQKLKEDREQVTAALENLIMTLKERGLAGIEQVVGDYNIKVEPLPTSCKDKSVN